MAVRHRTRKFHTTEYYRPLLLSSSSSSGSLRNSKEHRSRPPRSFLKITTVDNSGNDFFFTSRSPSIKFDSPTGVVVSEKTDTGVYTYTFASDAVYTETKKSPRNFEILSFGNTRALVGIEGGSYTYSGTYEILFSRCTRLTKISFPPGFGSGDNVNMSDMFGECIGLGATVPLQKGVFPPGFGSGDNVDMSGMFQACDGLGAVPIPKGVFPDGFGSGNSVELSEMFAYCTALVTQTPGLFPETFGQALGSDKSVIFINSSFVPMPTFPWRT